MGTETGTPLAALATDLAHADIGRILRLARAHLGLDVAFVGEFRGDARRVRHVDREPDAPPLEEGTEEPLGETYCALVASATIPAMVPDARDYPILRALPVTTALNVRAHVGVPITFSNGRVYGTLCGFSQEPDPSLRQRDADVLALLAALIAERLEREDARDRARRDITDRVREVLDGAGPAMVYQAIHDLADGVVVGYEALARFPDRTPDVWFAEAQRVGLGTDLELAAVANALTALPAIPREARLWINVGGDALASPDLARLIAGLPESASQRLTLELTEHDAVRDPAALLDATATLRALGVQIAIDDAGSGYAGLLQVVSLGPDAIKLDREITRGVDADRARQAMFTASVAYARTVGVTLLAEGIETGAELATLRRLGVKLGQGFHLGRPTPAPWSTATPNFATRERVRQ